MRRRVVPFVLAVLVVASGLVAVAVASDPKVAEASHITGSVGLAEYHNNNDGTTEVHLTATITTTWVAPSYFGSPLIYTNQNGSWTVYSVPATCGSHTTTATQLITPVQDPSLQTIITGQYAAGTTKVTIDSTCMPQGQYLFYFLNCCRVSGITNNGSQSTSLEYVLNVGGPTNTATPSFNASLLSNVAYGLQASFSQYLNALGAGNSAVTYEIVTNTGSAPLQNGSDALPCSTLDGTTGLLNIRWQNCAGADDTAKQTAFATAYSGGTPNSPKFYAFKVKVTDSDGNISTRDVLFRFAVNTNQTPVLTTSPSCSALAMRGGETTTIVFDATDPDSGETLAFVTNTLPSWATLSITGANTTHAVATLTLAPPAGLNDVAQIVVSTYDNNTFSLATSSQCNIVVGAATLPGFQITPVVATPDGTTILEPEPEVVVAPAFTG